MGSNRRYGSDVSAAAITEAATRPTPISLTKAEVGDEPMKQPEQPLEVEAWVRFPETPVKILGRAVAWNDRAVCVEFEMRDGRTRRTWVWASAVRRPKK